MRNICAQRRAGTNDPEIKSRNLYQTELATHAEFDVLVFVRLLLLYHLFLIATTLGGSELIILTKQELTRHLETRWLSPAVINALSCSFQFAIIL